MKVKSKQVELGLKIAFALLLTFLVFAPSARSVIIISAEPDRQGFPELAFGPDTFLVVWQDMRSGLPNTEDVYAARVTLQGEVLEPHGISIAVKTGAIKFIRQPTWDGENWFVHWMTDSSNGDVWLMGARMTRAGVVLDPEGKRLLNYYGHQFNQGAAYDGQNHFVVWYDTRQSGGGPGLYGARITRDLVTLDPNGILLWSGPAGMAEVAFDGRNYCVVWPEYSDPQHPRILTGRVRPEGVVLDTLPIDVFPRDTGVVFLNAPDIAFGDSVFLIVACWDSLGYDNIFGARISPQGVLLDSTAIPVSRPVSFQTMRWQPRVSFNGSFFQVVWYREQEPLHQVVEGARVEPSGLVRDTMQVRVVRDTTGIQHDPNVASSQDGRSLVIWGNEAGGQFDVYGVFVDTTGCQVGLEQRSGQVLRGSDLSLSLSISPCPVRERATILFSLPEIKGRPVLGLYDITGREVRVLKVPDASSAIGSRRILWDGRNDQGRRVPAGVYFLKLEALGRSAVRRVVVVR